MVVADFYLLASMTPRTGSNGRRAESIDKQVFYYELAVAQDPKNRDMVRSLAELALKAGDLKKAAELYQRLIDEQAETRDFMSLIAVRLASGNENQTMEAMDRMLEAASGDEASGLLGELLTRFQAAGNRNLVVYAYHRLIESSSEQAGEAYLRELARYHESLERSGSARTYEVLMARRPEADHAEMYKKSASFIPGTTKPGRPSRPSSARPPSIRPTRTAAQSGPALPVPGDQEKYLDYMIRALKADPANVNARLKLVDILREAGKKDEARAELIEVVRDNRRTSRPGCASPHAGRKRGSHPACGAV